MSDSEEELLATGLDAIPAQIAILDASGTIVWTNRAWQAFAKEHDLQMRPDTVGVNYLAVTDESDDHFASAAAEGIRAVIGGERTQFSLEYPCHSPEEERWFLMWATSFSLAETPYAIILHLDISQRHEYEAELVRYKELITNIPVGIYRSTIENGGKLLEVNPALIEMFDATDEEELLNRRVDELYVNQADRHELLDQLEEEGVVTKSEVQLTTISGRRFWASITAVAHDSENGPCIDGVIQDITDEIKYERLLEQQRDNLEILNKVVRHDIRNHLQLILGYTDEVSEHVDDEGQAYLEVLSESTEDAIELTNKARDLATVMQQPDGQRRPTPLLPYLQEQCQQIADANPTANITIDESVPNLEVKVDDLFETVLRNILANAIKHNDTDQPTVDISAETTPTSVILSVADNGPGMANEQKERVFEEGIKSSHSSGSGLGLYLVQSIIDRYNGAVWIEDNDPRGTKVVLELPRGDDQ